MSAPFTLSYVALWVLVILQGLLLLGLTRAIYQLRGPAVAGQPTGPLQQYEGERLAGQLAPRIDARDVFGTRVTSDGVDGGLRAVLFVSPTCTDCMVSLDELSALQHKVKGSIIAVCVADTEQCRLLAEDNQLIIPVLADPDQKISKSFDVFHTPTAVTLNRSGRILQYGHPGRDGSDMAAILHNHDGHELPQPAERRS